MSYFWLRAQRQASFHENFLSQRNRFLVPQYQGPSPRVCAVAVSYADAKRFKAGQPLPFRITGEVEVMLLNGENLNSVFAPPVVCLGDRFSETSIAA